MAMRCLMDILELRTIYAADALQHKSMYMRKEGVVGTGDFATDEADP